MSVAGQALTQGTEKRETASSVIFDKISYIANVAEEVKTKCRETLVTVSSDAEPQPPTNEKIKRSMPPYFSELDSKLDSIYNSLVAINDQLDRTEF